MGFLNGRVTYVRYRVGGDEPLAVRRGDPGAGSSCTPSAGTARATRPTASRRLGGRRPRPRPDLRPRQEHHQRRAPPGHPGRHRQDPRLAAAGLHPDRDRRPGPAEPQRLPDQGPAAGGQGGRPDPRRGRGRRRPVPPDGPLSRPLGRPVRTSSTPARPARSVLDRLQTLFRETFDRTLEPITAGSLAYSLAEARGEERSVEDFGPVGFVGEDGGTRTVAWADADARAATSGATSS